MDKIEGVPEDGGSLISRQTCIPGSGQATHLAPAGVETISILLPPGPAISVTVWWGYHDPRHNYQATAVDVI
jgi:hypothetical protein